MALNSILFVGPIWEGSTSLSRMKGLKKLGLDVRTLDSTPWVGDGPKILRSLNHRIYFRASVRAMNAALIRAGAENHPDAVWVDKGNWIYPSTLRRLRKHTRFLIHYNTDDVFARGAYFWLHRLGLRQYDVYLTTNRWNVLEIRQRYRVKALRAGMGYDHELYRPPLGISSRRYTHEIVFVGHWQQHTERCIAALMDSGLKVGVWGHNWRKAKRRELRLCKHLPYADYVETIGGAKIALCFLSKRNRNESTGRSFEIPAIGSFMLAERTTEHEFLFADRVGAGLFSDEGELIQEVHYYLENSGERETIASAGHARCQSLGLSWTNHLKREWPILERILMDNKCVLRAEDDQPFWKGFREGEGLGEDVRRSGEKIFGHRTKFEMKGPGVGGSTNKR